MRQKRTNTLALAFLKKYQPQGREEQETRQDGQKAGGEGAALVVSTRPEIILPDLHSPTDANDAGHPVD